MKGNYEDFMEYLKKESPNIFENYQKNYEENEDGKIKVIWDENTGIELGILDSEVDKYFRLKNVPPRDA